MRKLRNSELGRLNLEEFRQAEKIPLIVILDDVRSLHNIGSVFRTADAFLVNKIYLCGITATPPNKEIHKTALGATDSVCWEYRKEILPLLAELRQNGVKIVCIEQAQNSILLQFFKVVKEEKIAVIFGNEVKGVDQKVVNDSDICIEIPQYGTKHSLNIAVSCGIVLWDLFKQFKF